MSYLYRFDPLERLRAQLEDPVLRAKRVTRATGSFDHHQVLTELAEVDSTKGVYRFCFWKSWDAAVKHFHPYNTGNSVSVIQRISADHPVFSKFKKDDDEYLARDAWIFWQSSHIDVARPNWSRDGIPHDDIEVLTSGGNWECLSTSTLMRDASYDVWRCLPLRGVGSPTPVYTRTIFRRINGKNQIWVMLRQQSGPWTTIWHDTELLADAVRLLLNNFSLVALSDVRWVVSFECSDRILSAEFRPHLSVPRKSFWDRIKGQGKIRVEDLNVTVDEYFTTFNPVEQKQLYADFGIAELLLLSKRYQYSPKLLSSRFPG